MSVVTDQAVTTGVFPGPRVVSADPEYMGIVDFLHDEAILLDRDQYVAWTEMLAEDVTYTIPRRKTLDARDGTGLNEAMASAERRDILRLTDDGFKLVRRRLIFDQAMMAATLPNVIL